MSKTIVIIGASAAGGNAAKQLLKTLPSTYRIVLIEQNNFAYWPIGALRAMVQPGFEESIIAPLDRLLPAKSRHIMITGRKVVTLRKDRIVLDSGTSDFPDGKISFEVCYLARKKCIGS
jgi:NADH dehydrogenase FAD-containing subunit